MTSILGIAGGFVAAEGHKMAAQQSAQIMDANAKAAAKDAELSRLAAQVDAEYITEDARAAKGRARATAAAQGATTLEGSPLIALMDMVKKERRAVLRRQFVGEVEAAKFLTEAEFFKKRSKDAKKMGTINALTTMLSGAAASGYDFGYRGQQKNLSGSGGGGYGGPNATSFTGESGNYGGDLAGTEAGGAYF